MAVTDASTFDVNKVMFSAPSKAVGQLAAKVYINYAGRPGHKLAVQTPKFARGMLKTWGTNTTESKTCAFPLDPQDGDSVTFATNVLKNIDMAIVSAATSNAQEWFGRKMSSTEININYKSLVKPSSDPGRWTDLFSTKISLKDGLPSQIRCFDETEAEVDFGTWAHAVQDGAPTRVIVEIPYVYVLQNKSFGAAVYIRAAQFFPKPQEGYDLEMGFPFM